MSWRPFSCPLGAAAGFVLCTCPTGESNKNFYQELMISSFFPRQVKHQLAPLALVANCQSWWNCRAQHEDRVGLCTGTLPRPAQQRAAQTAQPSHHKSLGRQILWWFLIYLENMIRCQSIWNSDHHQVCCWHLQWRSSAPDYLQACGSRLRWTNPTWGQLSEAQKSFDTQINQQ